jgi:hypothetical protein
MPTATNDNEERARLISSGRRNGQLSPAEARFFGQMPVETIRAWLVVATPYLPIDVWAWSLIHHTPVAAN